MSRIDEIQARVAQSLGREPTSNTTSNTTASRIDQAQQSVLSNLGPRVLDNPTPYATYTTPEPQQVSTPVPVQTNTPTQAEIDWGKQYGFLSDDLLKEMNTPQQQTTQQPTTPKAPTTEEVNWGKEHRFLSDDLLKEMYGQQAPTQQPGKSTVAPGTPGGGGRGRTDVNEAAAAKGMTVDEYKAYLTADSNLHALDRAAQTEMAGIQSLEDQIKQLQDRNNALLTANYGAGNINLSATPRFDNGDGTYSTVDSMSFYDDKTGLEILIPTVVQIDGQWYHVDEEQAIEQYRKTGKYLGAFRTPEEADVYANQLHEQQEQLFSERAMLSAQINALQDTYKGLIDKYNNGVYRELQEKNDRFLYEYNPIQYYKEKGQSYDAVMNAIAGYDAIIESAPAGSDEYNAAKRRRDQLYDNRMLVATDEELEAFRKNTKNELVVNDANEDAITEQLAELYNRLASQGINPETNPEYIALQSQRHELSGVFDDYNAAGKEIAHRDAILVDQQAKGTDAEKYLDALAEYAKNGAISDETALSLFGDNETGLRRFKEVSGGLTGENLAEMAKTALKKAGFSRRERDNAVALLLREGNSLRAEASSQRIRDFTTKNLLTEGLMTGVSFGTNILGGLTGPIALLGDLRSGDTLDTMDPNSAAFTFANMTNDIRGAITDKHNLEVDLGFTKLDLADAAYGIFTSSVDSMLAGSLGSAALGGAVIGMQAGTQAAIEVAQNGGSFADSVITGLAAGVFEGLFESVSIGQFQRLKEAKIGADRALDVLTKPELRRVFLRNLGKSALTNFSEEFNTELANVIFDRLKSEVFTNTKFNLAVANYRTQINPATGEVYTLEEAVKRVSMDQALQIGGSGLSGLIQGVLMGGVAQLSGVRQVKAVRDYVKDLSSTQKHRLDMLTMGNTFDDSSETKQYSAQKLQEINAVLNSSISAEEKATQLVEILTTLENDASKFDQTFADELGEYAPAGYNNSAVMNEALARLSNDDATPPHIETETETRIRETQQAVGMSQADATATAKLLFQLVNGETNLQTRGIGLDVLKSESFKNAVQQLTGMELKGENIKDIKRSLNEISKTIRESDAINLNPEPAPEVVQDNLVPPTNTQTAPTDDLSRNGWYNTTAEQDAFMKSLMSQMTGNAVAGENVQDEAPAQQPEQPAQPVHKRGDKIQFSAAESTEGNRGNVSATQRLAEKIYNVLLHDSGVTVRVVSGDPALVGATGANSNGEIVINADMTEYTNPVTGQRHNVDAGSFAGMSWILGHELYHEYEHRVGADAAIKRVQDLMKALVKDGVLSGRYAEIIKSDKAWDKLRNAYRPRWIPLVLSDIRKQYGDTISDTEALELAKAAVNNSYIDAEIAGDFIGSLFGFHAGNTTAGLLSPNTNRTQALISLANADRPLVQDTADRVADAVEAAGGEGQNNAEVDGLKDFLIDLGTALYATRKDGTNASQYSAAEYFDMKLSEQIDLSCRGDIDYRDSLAVMKESPELMDKINFPKGPYVYPQSKFFLNMSAHEETMYEHGGYKKDGPPRPDKEIHWHTVAPSTMENLDELIKNPAMIYKYHNDDADVEVRNSVIVVTTDLDRNGNPVVVAIRPSEWERVGGESLKANVIVTVFGMKDFFFGDDNGGPSKLDVIRDNDLLLSINKEKYQELTQKYKERFPDLQTPDADLSAQVLSTLGTNDIIRKWGRNVNGYNGNGFSYTSHSAVDDGMYSPLENFVGDLRTDKNGNLNAQHIMGQIKGNNGALNEAKAIGLAEYLEGRQTIAKSELSQFIRDNTFKLMEDRRESGPEFWAIKNNDNGAIYGNAAELSTDAKVIATNRGLRYDGYKIVGGGNGLINLSNGAIKQTYVAYATDAAGNQVELFRADSTKIGMGGTKFNDVTLMGGDNYTEQLYVVPNSEYTNPTMRKHWGNTRGVLMHVRTKDFRTSNNAKVLLVEEMQSDWHNAGSKNGYESNGGPVPNAPYRNSYIKYLFNRMLMRAVDEDYDLVAWTNSNSQMYRGNPYFERNEKGNIRGLQGYVNEYDRDLPNLARKYGEVETLLLPKAAQFATPKRYMDLMRQYSETETQMNQLNENMRNGANEDANAMVQQGDQLRSLSDKLSDLSKQMADIRNSGEMEEQQGVTVQGIRITDDIMDKVWDGLPRFSAADVGADGMYSTLEREIENLPTNKNGEVDTKNLLNVLRNRAQKVRGLGDEIKWSQLEDLVKEYNGQRAPKEDILNAVRYVVGAPVLRENLRESKATQPIHEQGQYVVDLGGAARSFDDREAAADYALAHAISQLGLDATVEDFYYDDFTIKYLENEDGELVTNPVTGEVAQEITLYAQDFDGYERIPIKIVDYGYSVDGNSFYETDETNFKGYTLNGGDDYTEHVYTLPGATYGGTAEEAHWDEPGVLLHTREQTMHTPDGKKVLFIEEVQSDWHNDASKSGYESKGGDVPDAPYGKTYTEYALKRMLLKAAQEGYDYIAWTTPEMQLDRWNPWRVDNDLNVNSDNPKFAKGYYSTYGRDLPNAARRYGQVVDVALDNVSERPYPSADHYLAYWKYDKAWNKLQEAQKRLEEAGAANASDLDALEEEYDRAEDELRAAEDEFDAADSTPNHGGDAVESVPGIEITPELRDRILNEGLPRYSAAGFHGADEEGLTRLEDAKRWHREGRPMEQIYHDTQSKLKGHKTTGWWLDPTDGKWRFEISDKEAMFMPYADARRYKDDEDYKKLKDEYQRLKKKANKNQLTDNQKKQFAEIKKQFTEERDKIKEEFMKNGGTIGDVLRHEELYRAYPQIEDAKIRYENIPDDEDGRTLGYFEPPKSKDDLGTIVVNSRYWSEKNFDSSAKNADEAVRNTILHEVQHMIQRIEGFDSGYNSKTAKKVQEQAWDNLRDASKKYVNANKSAESSAAQIIDAVSEIVLNGENGFDAINPNTGELLDEVGNSGRIEIEDRNGDAVRRAIKTYLKALQGRGIISADEGRSLYSGLANVFNATTEARYVSQLGTGEDAVTLSPFDLYQATHGEQEARTTSERSMMNITDRENNMPYIPTIDETRRPDRLNEILNKRYYSAVENNERDPMLTDILNRMQGQPNYSAAEQGEVQNSVDYQDWYKTKAPGDRQELSKEQYRNKQDYRATRRAENIPYTGTRKGYVTNRQAQTLINAGITPDEMAESLKSAVANGAYQHMQYSDQSAMNKANKEIEYNGWEAELGKYRADVLDGKASKDITAMGIALYNNAVTNGDLYTAMDIASLMIKNSSSIGSALQASRMLNKITPDGKLYTAVRSIENIADELRGIYGDEYSFELDYGLIEDYRNALISGDEAQQKEAWKAIEQSIADQIPHDWKHAWRLKFNNWRYLAMLGNPRTHIRNIVGNLFFAPVRLAKQGVKAVMERMVLGQAGEGSNRTTAMLNPFSSEDSARRQAARADYDNVVDLIQSGGKMSSTKGEIENLRTVYSAKFLEWFRKRNGDLLDREDTWFSRPAYAEALASFLKARGIDGDAYAAGNISSDLLNQAREHAILEAQKATYRDTNQFSAWVSSLGAAGRKKNASKVQKIASGALEAVLPFKKTPANILVRAVEYSPAEFGQVFFGDIKKVRQAQAATRAAEAKSDGSAQALREIAQLKEQESLAVSGMLDHIASGLTGTVLLGLGALLRNLGIVSGGKDPDKEQAAFDELHGQQEYSINIGGVNYTIDWLAPEALPLFTGVTLYDKIKAMKSGDEDEEGDLLSNVWDLVVGLGEPMLNMSMLSSVNDLVSKMTYLDDSTQLPALLGQIGYSYISQYIPTLFGQVERIRENRRESTYYDRDDKLSKDLQYMLGKTANKIPVWDYNQIPYLDAWGQEQKTGEIGGDVAAKVFGEGARGAGNVLGRVVSNMVSPGYTRKRSGSELDDELQRLHDLGYEKMLPQRTTQSTKVDQEYMNEQEYVAYARLRGQTALADLTALTQSKSYQNMTDDQKAKAVSKIYEDAKTLAEDEVRKLRGEKVKGTNAKEIGLQSATFSAAKTIYDTATAPSWYNVTDEDGKQKVPNWAKMLAVLNDSSISQSDRLKFVNGISTRKEDFKTFDEAKACYTEARDEAQTDIKLAPAKEVYSNAKTPNGYKATASGNTPTWAKMLELLDSKGISDSIKLEYINSVSGRKEPYKSLDEARKYYEGQKADAKVK